MSVVLLAFEPEPDLQALFADSLSDFDVDLVVAPDREEARRHAAEAVVIVGWRPDRELLERAVNCRLFLNPGAGVQHLIPLFRELENPPPLVNGHGNAPFCAQHVVALLLSLTNRVIPHHQWMREGKWRTGDEDGPSIPLADRVVGLLGYGAINRRVHALLVPFGARFCLLRADWSRQEAPLPGPAERFTAEELPVFLQAVDVLIVALPLTSQTEGWIGATELEALGGEGLLVHVGRGPVIQEDALFEALSERRIGGAALDVWYRYSPEPDADGRKFPYHRPFHELDNVVLSPHRAASPMDDLDRWGDDLENVRRALQGRTDLLNRVDVDREY